MCLNLAQQLRFYSVRSNSEVGQSAFLNPFCCKGLFSFLLWLISFPTSFLPVNTDWLIGVFQIDEKCSDFCLTSQSDCGALQTCLSFTSYPRHCQNILVVVVALVRVHWKVSFIINQTGLRKTRVGILNEQWISPSAITSLNITNRRK